MAKVNFIDENLVIEAEKGSTILECIRKAGLKIETPCNALGMCGKCKVIAYGDLNNINKSEEKFINKENNERLACIAKVNDNCSIKLIKKNNKLKTINKGYSIEVKLNPSIHKKKINNLNIRESKPYSEYLNLNIHYLNVLNKISLIKDLNDVWAVIYKENIIDIVKEKDEIYGIGIDIGTTGISSYLINLENGKIINKISSLNPQTEFGGDVLTRITYCMNNENGLDDLKKSIIEEINRIIKEFVKDKFKQIYSIVIAGNTTMLHLLLGINPISLAKAPYRPVFLDAISLNAKDINVNINENGIFTVLPSASAYVGADIISGIVACGFENIKQSAIFVDIGTNGEIVAINNQKMKATSTAAGPALEGMNISCGCRAQEGAIESFNIDDDFNIKYSTIGNCEANGICGSGLIDVAAALVRKNVILKSGKFNKDLNVKLKNRLIDKKFYITDKIYISQKDIRQIQLAKGAIASGIIMLLKDMNIEIEDVKEAVIAGAFGYHVNAESIKDIGLIPKGFNGKISFVGNTSLEGTRIALINNDYLNLMKKLRYDIDVLELSTSDEFQKYFVKQLNF